MKPDAICEELVQCCLAPDGHMGGIGSDNMTVILVIFLKGVTLNYKGSLGENLVDNVVYYLPKDKPEASNDQNEKVDKSDWLILTLCVITYIITIFKLIIPLPYSKLFNSYFCYRLINSFYF